MRDERDKMQAFVAEMFGSDTGHDGGIEIVTESLPTWTAIIQGVGHFVTGNTAGMWLAIGSDTSTTVLQSGSKGHPHNQLWNIKPAWGCQNMEIITI